MNKKILLIALVAPFAAQGAAYFRAGTDAATNLTYRFTHTNTGARFAGFEFKGDESKAEAQFSPMAARALGMTAAKAINNKIDTKNATFKASRTAAVQVAAHVLADVATGLTPRYKGRDATKANIGLNALSHGAATGLVALVKMVWGKVPANPVTGTLGDAAAAVKDAAAENFGQDNVNNASVLLAWAGEAVLYQATKGLVDFSAYAVMHAVTKKSE